MHALVVGAGVVGLTCAAELVNRGVRVSVVERSERLFTNACSWSAGGMLAPRCERESAEERVMQLGLQAADWWARHVACVVRNGTLVIAHPRDRSEVIRFSKFVPEHVHLDAEQVAHLEPDLAGRFDEGLLFEDEAHLDPRVALEQLASYIQSRGGEILLGQDGTKLPIARDITIDCRGFHARDSLPQLRGVRGEMLLLKTAEVRLSRPIRLLHPRTPIYVVPREDGLFMVGATMIESERRKRVSARSVMELLSAAYSLHLSFGEAEVIELGADVRPAFPDNLPRINRQDKKLVVNGFYRHGFLLAPALAQMVALAALDPAYRSEFIYECAA